MARLFTGGSMGYIHCCGALHKTRSYCIVPQENFTMCEVDILSKCPVCGHTVVQLTRVCKDNSISVNYNEFGVKKRCYSNLKSLKIGLNENRY